MMLLPALRTATSLAAQNAATPTGAINLMFSTQHVLISQFTNTLKVATEIGRLSVAVMTSASFHSPTTTLINGRAKTEIADLSLKATWTKSTTTPENAVTRELAFASMAAKPHVTCLGQSMTSSDGNHPKKCAAAKFDERSLGLIAP